MSTIRLTFKGGQARVVKAGDYVFSCNPFCRPADTLAVGMYAEPTDDRNLYNMQKVTGIELVEEDDA